MATSRTNRERGDIPAGPADLQPGRDSRGSRVGSPGGLAVSAAELATLESDEAAFDEPSRRAAERLARLAVDRDLHDRLAAGRFRGPEYRQFANELAAYGLAVVTAWLLSGEMFQQCAARNRGAGSRPSEWTDHDIGGLANDCVTAALTEFRNRALAGTGWKYSEDGASVKTYFITGCVYAFPNVYRTWKRDSLRWSLVHDLHEVFDDVTSESLGAPDVATTALHRVEAAEAFAGMSETEKLMMYYHLASYTNAEIAELLRMRGPRAVEGVLHRLRNKCNKRRVSGGGHQ